MVCSFQSIQTGTVLINIPTISSTVVTSGGRPETVVPKILFCLSVQFPISTPIEISIRALKVVFWAFANSRRL